MKIQFVCNGNVDRIPPIGTQIQLAEHLFFKVESYGESTSTKDNLYKSKETFTIELIGALVIPAGSPMKVLDMVLNGRIKDLLK